MDKPGVQDNPENTYHAFLLRMWREPHDGRWRVMVEDPHTEERRAFRSVEAFIHFLKTLTA